MKEFNIRASDGSKATAEGFAAIGLDAEKMGASMAKGGEDGQKAFMATVSALAAMKDPMQQNAAGTALFGTQWEDVRSKVIVAMADGMKGIGDFKGATNSATKAMYDNNPGAALTSAMREMQAAIGPALLPLADIIKNTIVPAIKSLADWFANLSPAGQKMALTIIGIAAAIGPLLTILGPIISIIGSIVGGIGAISLAMAGGATGIGILTAAFPALGAVIAAITGPIGIAIAVITGLIAISLLLVKHWDDIKLALSAVWEWIKTTSSSIFTAIASFFTGIWDSITGALKAAWEGIKTYLSTLWEGIKTTASSAWEGFKTTIVSITKTLIDTIRNTWESILTWFTTLAARLKQYAIDMFTAMKNGVVSTVGSVKDAIVNGIQSALDWIKGLPGKMLEYGKNIIQGLIDGIKSMIDRVKNVVSDIADGIKNKIRGALGISSPSKVMMEIGQYTGQGLAIGMANTVGAVSQQAQYLASAAISKVPPANYEGSTVGGYGVGDMLSNSIGALLHADKIVIANDMDIQELANKLGFYYQQTAAAKGGMMLV